MLRELKTGGKIGELGHELRYLSADHFVFSCYAAPRSTTSTATPTTTTTTNITVTTATIRGCAVA
jgi:hypothetical protein